MSKSLASRAKRARASRTKQMALINARATLSAQQQAQNAERAARQAQFDQRKQQEAARKAALAQQQKALADAQAAQDKECEAEQEPKTKGSLEGRVIGAMDMAQFEAMQNSLTSALAFITEAISDYATLAERLAGIGVDSSPALNAALGGTGGGAAYWLGVAQIDSATMFTKFRAGKRKK